jgi:hypothetical protein
VTDQPRTHDPSGAIALTFGCSPTSTAGYNPHTCNRLNYGAGNYRYLDLLF